MPEPHAAETPENDKQIAEMAIKKGYVTSEQVEKALEAKQTIIGLGMKRSLAEVMVEKGLITNVQAEAIAVAATAGDAQKVLAGYELMEKLGEGGMGMVFKARHIALDKLVALKILPERLAKDAEFVARFEREAKVAAKMDHVNIVRALDVGEADNVKYFAMEYVEGRDIGGIIDNEGKMTEDASIDAMLQSARALEHADKNNMIHRDIKPDNILLTADGVAKVADLGLARSTGDDVTRMTVTGTAMGTPHYISPEQARGESDVDIRTDIYSLGVTFFHMLTGHPPFQGSTAAIVITRRLTEAPPWIRDVDPTIGEGTALVVRKMMARERDDRYLNPTELIKDLELLADNKMPVVAAGAPGVSATAPAESSTDATMLWEQGPIDDGTGVTIPQGKLVEARAQQATNANAQPSKLSGGAMAGITVAALAILAVVLMFALGGQDKGELGKIYEDAIASANDYVAKGDYRLAIGKLKGAQSKLLNSEYESKLNSEIARLLNEQSAKATESNAEEKLASIKEYMAEGKLEKAEEAVTDAIDKYSATSLAEEFSNLKKKIRAEQKVAVEIDKALDKVKTLESVKSFDEALKAANAGAAKYASSLRAKDFKDAIARITDAKKAQTEKLLADEAHKTLLELQRLYDAKKYAEVVAKDEPIAGKYANTTSGIKIANLVKEARGKLESSAQAKQKSKDELNKAATALRQKDYEAAIAHYNSAKNYDASLNLTKQINDASYALNMAAARKAEERGSIAKALKSVEDAIKFKRTEQAFTLKQELTTRLAALELAKKGELAHKNNNLAEAVNYYNAALRKVGDNPERKKIAAALDVVKKEMAYNAAIKLANKNIRDKKWKAASKAVEDALKAKPADQTALTLKGMISAQLESSNGTAVVTTTPTPPSSIFKNSIGMEFVKIPSGTYTIGSDEGDADERPVHTVTLKAYRIGMTEVTNGQYRKFNSKHKNHTQYSPGDNNPVVGVTYKEAVDFCKWLSRKERKSYRLPTEAEWEAAARGNEAHLFPWGSHAAKVGNKFFANWGDGKDETSWRIDGYAYTAPVGSFPDGASMFGCLDMAGNVFEWCSDWYDSKYYSKEIKNNPQGPRHGVKRILRGGSWYHDATIMNAANRFSRFPTTRKPYVGFRVVLSGK